MSDEKQLLTEIRENFDFALTYWQPIRDEGRIDMRYVAGDPWDPRERKARAAANRPCISPDELNQYLNQLVNDIRQNPRGVKVLPRGNGANDKTAEFRGDLIRQIEHQSNAKSAYTTAFQCAAERSYGFVGVSKEYVSSRSFNQRLKIRRFANPDAVLIDPDAKEADAHDMNFAFVLDRFRKSAFKRKFPEATAADFSSELIEAHNASKWITADHIQVAEYWRRELRRRMLLLIDDGGDGLKQFADELTRDRVKVDLERQLVITPEGRTMPIVNSRPDENATVWQYLTNGVEILQRVKWDGRTIPIVPCFGKELWLDEGAGAVRKLMSLTRLARDPQMLYAYYRTCQAELVGQIPKVPWVMYEGQQEGHEQEWDEANRSAMGYLLVKPVLDATGQNVLPLPQRNVWEPPIQALEMGAEAARRAIQSACGMYNASVGKRDTNAQSGVAIEKLDTQSSQGSYHFVDNYEVMMTGVGRILNECLDATYDSPREEALRKPDDKHVMVRLNERYTDEKGQEHEYRTGVGEHDVDISTGPSFQSQREEVNTFAETLAQNPAVFPLIADLIVKLKNLGPIGDEIAKRLTPPEYREENQQQISPEQFAQLQTQNQQLQAQLAEATNAAAGNQAKIASDERIALMKIKADMLKTLIQLDSAESLEMFKAELAQLDALTDQQQLEQDAGDAGAQPIAA